jgi:neutral amino acid transport system substrate-binding protein
MKIPNSQFSLGQLSLRRVGVFLSLALFLGACSGGNPSNNAGSEGSGSEKAGDGEGLKLGTLLPATGDLASVGQPMIAAIPMMIDTINACGGVNGKPVTLAREDDQTDPSAGNAAMTKLAEVDKVGGVVGSFASSVSQAAVDVAKRNKVMLISPGSTSPEFTKRAKNGDFSGYWSRTAPPDTYQARALAKLASEKGFKKVSTIAINNDYGIGFEQEFIEAFTKFGGTVVNADKPTRYDPKATTFDTEAKAAFAGDPEAVIAILYPDTGSILLKTAYQQGLMDGVQLMLTDGVKSDEFASQVGKKPDGKFIIDGAIGTVPGADGKALDAFAKVWQAEKNEAPPAYAPQAWDATALLALAAEASKGNTGEGISTHLRAVAGEGGTEVSDVCEGLKLLREGQDINYQGASGNVDIDEYGDVLGVYDVWQVQTDGKLKVIQQVLPDA